MHPKETYKYRSPVKNLISIYKLLAERRLNPEIYKKWTKYLSDITKNPTHCIEYFNINVMGFDQALLVVISNQICLHSSPSPMLSQNH